MNFEFPDPDEEFDLIHENEYEVLKEIEGITLSKFFTKLIALIILFFIIL